MRIMNKKEKEYVTLVEPRFQLGCQEMSTKGRSLHCSSHVHIQQTGHSNVLMVPEQTLCHHSFAVFGFTSLELYNSMYTKR